MHVLRSHQAYAIKNNWSFDFDQTTNDV